MTDYDDFIAIGQNVDSYIQECNLTLWKMKLY
jgi:hypothetical protein